MSLDRKRTHLDVRTSLELKDAIATRAKREGKSVSETAREILEESLLIGKTASSVNERLERVESLLLRTDEQIRSGFEILLVVCGNVSPEDAREWVLGHHSGQT